MAKPPADAFLAVRDLIVDEFDDEDRRRLADLLGAMNDAKPELSLAVVRALAAIATLPIADRKILAGRCGRYLNRFPAILEMRL
jgi:hypothetical protein